MVGHETGDTFTTLNRHPTPMSAPEGIEQIRCVINEGAGYLGVSIPPPGLTREP